MKPISSPYAGFDKFAVPPIDGWMDAIYDSSNFSFTGVYLTHHPPNVLPYEVTDWVKEFTRIALGRPWGVAFFFLGYSVGHRKEVRPAVWWPTEDKYMVSERDIRARGKDHAILIKELVNDMLPTSEGSVVFVDNEDPVDNDTRYPDLWRNLMIYYDALFTEMKAVGPNNIPAVRPGFYAHPELFYGVLDKNPDIFMWVVKAPPELRDQFDRPKPPRKRIAKAVPPFEQKDNPARIDFSLVLQNHFQLPVNLKGGRTALPVSRQGNFWFEDNHSMPTVTLTTSSNFKLQPVEGWDFDMSFVRDPRYPVANPRIAILDGIVIRGTFNRDGYMEIHQVYNADHVPISGKMEPEAPLILTPGCELFTIDKNQRIASTLAVAGPPASGAALPNKAWPEITPIHRDSSAPGIRRIRALAITKRHAKDTHLFYVSTVHSIVVCRRNDDVWGKHIELELATPLHPFSNIASTTRGGISVDIFFINRAGCLCTAAWYENTNEYPNVIHLALQHRATLLPGTAIACVSPSVAHILVFAIGTDLRLYMSVFTANDKWTPLAPVKSDPKIRVFAHARIDTHVYKNVVHVATISDTNVPCVYNIKFQGGFWKAGPRDPVLHSHVAHPLEKNRTDLAPKSLVTQATQWDINPFGDVVLKTVENDLLLSCAGVTPGDTTVLLKKINIGGSDWMRVRR
ncbi:hypothetical protein Forpi1262_v016364 [Fusarium oxysporum f. sp. raphani]|uniref:Uncharacterized protein n=1 Tax=Fusarium oxysporum f. sp. raphani TaxID=96318 RepID=A0A8J5U074_FUSOX|nr:hypothetical protein Forpi1262_v016364 [Fusarium oxysporum f. sp. raphani]